MSTMPEPQDLIDEMLKWVPGPDEIAFHKELRSPDKRRKAGALSAPNCFGRHGLFELESNECSPCPWKDRCGVVAASDRERALTVRTKYGKPIPDLTPDQPPRVAVRNGTAALLRQYHLRKHAFSQKKYAVQDKVYRDKKKATPPTPGDVVKKQYYARLDALRKAIAVQSWDKMLQQLRGREEHILGPWLARQIAQLDNPTMRVSDNDVAETYRSIQPRAGRYSKHQARGNRELVQRLERTVWKRFVTSKGTGSTE